LTLDRYEAFLWRPIPDPLDDDVRAVVRAYLQADPNLREAILDHSIGEAADVLERFAERQAVEAVRTGSASDRDSHPPSGLQRSPNGAHQTKGMGFAAKGTGPEFYYDDASPY
jgi:hypothetical protein